MRVHSDCNSSGRSIQLEVPLVHFYNGSSNNTYKWNKFCDFQPADRNWSRRGDKFVTKIEINRTNDSPGMFEVIFVLPKTQNLTGSKPNPIHSQNLMKKVDELCCLNTHVSLGVRVFDKWIVFPHIKDSNWFHQVEMPSVSFWLPIIGYGSRISSRD